MDTEYEIQHMLVLSTGHIREKDKIILEMIAESEEYPDAFIVFDQDYGFLISICQESLEDAEAELRMREEYQLSDEFIHLLHLAISLDCNFLMLDRDGIEYPNLPVFDW